MKNPHDIIRRPVLTERSYDQLADKLYTFEVAMDVKVAKVNTLRTPGKLKRMGRSQGQTPEVKKAFVRLAKDSKAIAFFEGMVQ